MISIRTPWRGYINSFTCNISFEHSHRGNSQETVIHLCHLGKRYTKWIFPKFHYPGWKNSATHRNSEILQCCHFSYFINNNLRRIVRRPEIWACSLCCCILNLLIVISVNKHVHITVHVCLICEIYFICKSASEEHIERLRVKQSPVCPPPNFTECYVLLSCDFPQSHPQK